MNGYPLKNDRGMSVIGMNPQRHAIAHLVTVPGGSRPQMRPLRINRRNPPSPPRSRCLGGRCG